MVKRPWLSDPSGALNRILDLVIDVEDARRFLHHFRRCGQVFEIGARSAFLGDNDIAVLLSLEFERRRGEDIYGKFAYAGEFAGRDYDEIFAGSEEASDWEQRLAETKIKIVGTDDPQSLLDGAFFSVRLGEKFS